MLLFVAYLGVNLGALLLAAQSQRQPRRYLNSTAVTLSELLKLATSLLAVYASAPSAGAAAQRVASVLLGNPAQLLRVAVPALLYTIQNNLIYAALSHLDSLTFQVTYQLKIVAAMIASSLLLRRKQPPLRWLAVVLLTVGVALVQLAQADDMANKASSKGRSTDSDAGSGAGPSCAGCSSSGASRPTSEAVSPSTGEISSHSKARSGGKAVASPFQNSECNIGGASSTTSASAAKAAAEAAERQRNRTLGLAGVLIACLCSGLAGGVMELLLKSSVLPLADRNLQVAAVSLLLASAHMFTNDSDALASGGFFQVFGCFRRTDLPALSNDIIAHAPLPTPIYTAMRQLLAHPCPGFPPMQGYSPPVVAMVGLDSLGGILVSLLLKHASTTLKNFAAPLGIILNALLQLRTSKQRPHPKFLLGTLLVLLALLMYGASAT